MNEPRDRRQAPFEIPDLEVPAPRPSQSGMHAVQTDALRPQSPRPAVSGRELDDDPTLGPSLELDHGERVSAPVETHYARVAGFDAEDLAASGAHSARRLATAIDVEASWPTGTSRAGDRVLIDPAEVRAVGGYGDPPSAAWLTPVYALRVTLRRQQLLARAREISVELAALENSRERLLGELASSVLPKVMNDRAFSSALRQLDGAGERRPEVLARIGRAVLAARGAVPVDPALLARMRTADEQVERCLRRSELHLRALDFCDSSKVRQGYFWILAAVGSAIASVAYTSL